MGTGLKEPLQGDQDLSLVSIKQIVVQELIISLSLFIHAMLMTVKCMYMYSVCCFDDKNLSQTRVGG